MLAMAIGERAGASAHTVNVAVVDDDGGVRGALARLLRAAGFNPVGYSSAESFLADPMRAQTDCLVLDVHLGGMSGLDLQERLTARPIALSGSVSPSASSPSRPTAGPSA
jgi:FixJ family two-component response regulator